MNKKPNSGNSNLKLDIYRGYLCCCCFKIPEGEIYCCKKCHPICLKCRYASEDNTCPKCRDTLPVKEKFRNKHLEEILDGMEFECEFSGKGCSEKLPRQMLSRHFKTCRYRVKAELQIEDDCLIVYEQKHHVSSLAGDTQLHIDPFYENGSLNVATATTSSSQFGLENQPQEVREDISSYNGEKETTPSRMGIDNDDEEYIEGETPGVTTNEENNTDNPEHPSSSTNRDSRKRKIIETKIRNDPESAEPAIENKVIDIFSFSTDQTPDKNKKPELMKEYIKCKIAFQNDMDASKILKVLEVLCECGSQFEELFVCMPYTEENLRFLRQVLDAVPNLRKLIYHYQHGQDALTFLTALKVGKEKGNFPTLTCLKLVGASGKDSLNNEHIRKLVEIGIKFKGLEIGNFLREDVKSETLEELLEYCKDSLKSFVIHGGFRGKTGKANKVLTFPTMKDLTVFCLYRYYNNSSLSTFNNPPCKKVCILETDGEKEEPIKVTVKFQNSFPSLKFLALGNFVEVEDLHFSTIQNLHCFSYGGSWNLSIPFPAESSRIFLIQSAVTSLKFPDALKDPSFPDKVAKHFPKLREVSLYYPSVAVLQAFFKAFQNSLVEKLYLRTQFDVPFILESCLFPGVTTVVQDQDEETKALIRTLKKYKHFKEYAAHHNLELPSEQMNEMNKINYPGIGDLKNLKLFSIRHIPRNLSIPVVDEDRKWYDPKCKFMKTTLGFQDYPLTDECVQLILKLNQVECYPTNMICKSTGNLYEGIIKKDKQAPKVDEELFRFGKINLRSAARVKMMPSMLLPRSSFKSSKP